MREFWERHPLFTGESGHEPGSLAFFEEHRRICIEDNLGGHFDPRLLPPEENRSAVLDLGCGPGFWAVELQRRCKIEHFVAADLTEAAVALTRRRLACYALPGEVRRENAEALSFADGSFAHVNCVGVVHHTPDTRAAIAQIARVLQTGGTACIAVYHRNWVLRHWSRLRLAGRVLARLGARLAGRGREGIFAESDVERIVRLYDGAGNPVGKAYDRHAFAEMLRPHFSIEEIYYHLFPARSLPFRIPRRVHRWLDRRLGFLIYANMRKP